MVNAQAYCQWLEKQIKRNKKVLIIGEFVDVKDLKTGQWYRLEDAVTGMITPDGSAFIYTCEPYEKTVGTNQVFMAPLYRLATRCFLKE